MLLQELCELEATQMKPQPFMMVEMDEEQRTLVLSLHRILKYSRLHNLTSVYQTLYPTMNVK